MLNVKQWLVNTLTADSQIQTLLNCNATNMPLFPWDADIAPEQFPCITYLQVGGEVLSRPQGMYIGTLQVDIWSTNSALEVENLLERIDTLLNFKDSTSQTLTGTLWWIRKSREMDMPTGDRRLWRKSVDYKYWYNRTSNQ